MLGALLISYRKYYANLICTRFVAIRFLEQAIYEQIVPLAISPPPDIVTRVVVLYDDVSEHDLGSWTSARERAKAGPDYWKAVAGFDERARDANLYRALEWRAIHTPVSATRGS